MAKISLAGKKQPFHIFAKAECGGVIHRTYIITGVYCR